MMRLPLCFAVLVLVAATSLALPHRDLRTRLHRATIRSAELSAGMVEAELKDAQSAESEIDNTGEIEVEVESAASVDSAAAAAASATDSLVVGSEAYEHAVAAVVAEHERSFQAALAREAAAHRFSASLEATQQQSAAARLEVSVEATKYHRDSCGSIMTWLKDNGGTAACKDKDDATCHGLWVNAAAPNVLWQPIGLRVMSYCRWARSAGLTAVDGCTLSLMQLVFKSLANRENAKFNIASFTMGLEWELHWVKITPPNDIDPPASFPIWQSLRTHNIARQPWVKAVTDHGGPGDMFYTIPELIFGPAPVDTTRDESDSVTGISLGDMLRYVKNIRVSMPFKQGTESDPIASNTLCQAVETLSHNGGGRPLQHLPQTDFDHRTDYGTNGFLNPKSVKGLAGKKKDYKGILTQFQWSAMGIRSNEKAAKTAQDQWSAPKGKNDNNEYVQTNFLMPVSALCSQSFVRDKPMEAWQSDALRMARRTARAYVVRHMPGAALAALSPEDRGDLLGLYTGLFYQFMFRFVCIPHTNPTAYNFKPEDMGDFNSGFDSHNKNWFDHLLKTSFQRPILLASPALTGALSLMETAANNHGSDASAAQAVTEMVAYLKDKGNDPYVQKWGQLAEGDEVDPKGLRAWATAKLRQLLRAADPAHAADPSKVGAPDSISPTGSDPPAWLKGGDTVSVVVECRPLSSPLNLKARKGNVAGVNAELGKLLKRFTWNGKANGACV